MKRILSVPDPWLPVLALIASLLGLVAIWDAGYARAAESSEVLPRELISQVVWLCASMVAIGVCLLVRREKWQRAGWIACILCLVGILLVEVPGLGHEINHAKRWIKLPGMMIQPAEFAKLGLLLYLSMAFANRKPRPTPKRTPRNWGEWIDWVAMPALGRAWPLLPVVVAIVIIEREPDLATAMVIVVITASVLLMGGVRWGSLAALALLVVSFGAYWISREDYRTVRIMNHADRWSKENQESVGYQSTVSETAMASGGVFGVGLGKGKAKHILPAPTTDFILATISEEFGLLGSLTVLGLLGGIVYRLIKLAERTRDRYAKLVVAGVATWIGVHTCVNVMMANGKLPPIGIPLPFFSGGGSSLVALWAALGICLAVAREKATEEVDVEADRDGWRHGRTRLSRA